MPTTAKYGYQVQHMDVGFRETLRFAKLGAYLLHAAGLNATENGFGVEVLSAETRAWVLSRFAVEMTRYPAAGESFFVETWIEDFGRLFTTRNFKVEDAKGNLLGAGTSIWCLIDTKLRKAVDLRSKQGYEEFATGIPSLIEKPVKIPEIRSEPVSRHRIKYSDIDFNRHTNSMKYLEWMLDLFPLEVYHRQQVKRMDIHYLHEVVFGDVVDIVMDSPEPARHIFNLRKEEETVCRAQLLFENVV
jgi:medium-chain acyl-[acyl-carrier-protein] hydrolase